MNPNLERINTRKKLIWVRPEAGKAPPNGVQTTRIGPVLLTFTRVRDLGWRFRISLRVDKKP